MNILDHVIVKARAVDDFIASVRVDDSGVPYFKIALAFIVVEYVFHTYLDLRQRKVRRYWWP
jgi:hypothetical protein